VANVSSEGSRVNGNPPGADYGSNHGGLLGEELLPRGSWLLAILLGAADGRWPVRATALARRWNLQFLRCVVPFLWADLGEGCSGVP